MSLTETFVPQHIDDVYTLIIPRKLTRVYKPPLRERAADRGASLICQRMKSLEFKKSTLLREEWDMQEVLKTIVETVLTRLG